MFGIDDCEKVLGVQGWFTCFEEKVGNKTIMVKKNGEQEVKMVIWEDGPELRVEAEANFNFTDYSETYGNCCNVWHRRGNRCEIRSHNSWLYDAWFLIEPSSPTMGM